MSINIEKMTHYEEIKNANPKELAKILAWICNNDIIGYCDNACPYRKECAVEYTGCPISDTDVMEWWLNEPMC